MPYTELLNKLKTQGNQQNIKTQTENTIHLNAPEVIKMVKNRLRYGQGVNGGTIGGDREKANYGYYKNMDYASEKHKQNPLPGFGKVDLFFNGNLSDDITLKKVGDSFKVYSTDDKYVKIADKYGAEEFGLTDEQMQEFLHELYLTVMEQLINKVYE